jgi:hypothetical protein
MATTVQGLGYCAYCRRRVYCSKPGVDNTVHALVTLFLCGLWLPVWVLILVQNESIPFRCRYCGTEV